MSHSDEDLTRHFAKRHSSVSTEEFVTQVMTRIGRERRQRMLRKVTFALLLVVVAAAATPYAVEGSLAIASRFVDGLAAFGAALSSPVGWVCAIVLSVWVLRRAQIIGRR
jgi:hypothetical protein